MGKIHNSLRTNGYHDVPPPHAILVQPTIPLVEDVGPEVVGGDGVPFIEVGPRRQFEASPCVLASPAPTSKFAPTERRSGVAFRVLPEPKKSTFAPELVAFHAPDAAPAAQYAELLKSLILAGRRRPGTCQVLLFTGVRTEAGCTTSLLNVAISGARQGHRVLVVDANLRRPGIASRLGLADAPGLAEVLTGDGASDDAINETEQDNLAALTAGAPLPVLAEIANLRQLVAQMREAFDLVLIDGPRWDSRAVCLALAELADAVFLVAPATEADHPPATELARQLPALGVRLAGCVLTQV